MSDDEGVNSFSGHRNNNNIINNVRKELASREACNVHSEGGGGCVLLVMVCGVGGYGVWYCE